MNNYVQKFYQKSVNNSLMIHINLPQNVKKDSYFPHLLHPILMNYEKQKALLTCQKDENGNPCPFSERALLEYSQKFRFLEPMTDEEL